MKKIDPIRPTDDAARALARDLMGGATFGALGVIVPTSGAPSVTRVAVALGADGTPMTLVSSLSAHTKALRANPVGSLLLGEPADRGDPLTSPRITLSVRAAFIDREGPEHRAVRDLWLAQRPKSKLYVDFADFSFVRLAPLSATLNGGFGKAFELTPEDLAIPSA